MRSRHSCRKAAFVLIWWVFWDKNWKPAWYNLHMDTTKPSSPHFLQSSTRSPPSAVMPQHLCEGRRMASTPTPCCMHHNSRLVWSQQMLPAVPGGCQVGSANAAPHPCSDPERAAEMGRIWQHRETSRDTVSPSSKVIMLIKRGLSQQIQSSYLALSLTLQLQLHSRRFNDKDADYVTLPFFEAYGTGYGWREEIGLY